MRTVTGVLLAAVLGVAGCGGQVDPPAPPATEATSPTQGTTPIPPPAATAGGLAAFEADAASLGAGPGAGGAGRAMCDFLSLPDSDRLPRDGARAYLAVSVLGSTLHLGQGQALTLARSGVRNICPENGDILPAGG